MYKYFVPELNLNKTLVDTADSIESLISHNPNLLVSYKSQGKNPCSSIMIANDLLLRLLSFFGP